MCVCVCVCVCVGTISEEPETVGSVKVWTPTRKLSGEESEFSLIHCIVVGVV